MIENELLSSVLTAAISVDGDRRSENATLQSDF